MGDLDELDGLEENADIEETQSQQNADAQDINILYVVEDEKWIPDRVNHKTSTPTHHPSPIANDHPRPPPPPASLHPHLSPNLPMVASGKVPPILVLNREIPNRQPCFLTCELPLLRTQTFPFVWNFNVTRALSSSATKRSCGASHRSGIDPAS